jgi:thiol-disulfide isomerase/thioredoxin
VWGMERKTIIRNLFFVVALASSLQMAFAKPESLPWETNYTAAVAKAKAEHRPMFIMLTATWCGPCKMLEQHTLPDPSVREGLREFVWVKAYEDKKLNEKFALGAYPTLVFFDPARDKVLFKSVGYQQPRPFLRSIVKARQAGALPLNKEMQDLIAKLFEPDYGKIRKFVAAGDTNGLAKYLAPFSEDSYREYNILIAKIHPPEGLSCSDLVVTAGADQILPESGVFTVELPREKNDMEIRALAPGFSVIQEPLRVEDKQAVAIRDFYFQPLTERDRSGFQGRVVWSGKGQNASGVSNAIVRICDWATTRTDANGNFKFDGVAPGTFVVRAECPGGELQQELVFHAGKYLNKNLALKPVTTIGIRWAVQTKPTVRELTGPGVRTGEAYFSVDHSRFLLERGAEVREYWGSDFMLKSDWDGLRQYMHKDKLPALEHYDTKAPIFWFYDMGSHHSGFHRENSAFETVKAITAANPDDETYFEYLRGDIPKKGNVYTVRCVRKDCYAKLEITDVTTAGK